MTTDSRGFTLTELAIVLVIVGLLIGGMMVPLSVQRDLQSASETHKQLIEAKEALMGFASSHIAADGKPYLPCPDTDSDGFENRVPATKACESAEGRLPWNELGVGREDSWGNHLRYRITPSFANSATGFGLIPNAGSLKVCEDTTCTEEIGRYLPAVIVSHGKNGAGAYNQAGATNPEPIGLDEKENQDLNNIFVLRSPSNVANSEFDDLVVWISSNVLYSRMVSSKRLP